MPPQAAGKTADQGSEHGAVRPGQPWATDLATQHGDFVAQNQQLGDQLRLILVAAGTVTNYMGDDPACAPHVYSAGAGFIDPGGADVHMLRNDTSAPAETIAVQLLPNGADRRIDAPDPGNCPS
jgi:hypothetical protein